MIVLLGESASGKTTLQKMLIESNNKYKKIITYTTRPMRKGEVNGIDYHFLSQEKYMELLKKDFFVEQTEYNNWHYGTAKEDCENSDNSIAILTPSGFRNLKRLNIKITSIYLCVDRRSRLINILSRGDNIDEAYRRNLSDVGQFDEIDKEVDYVIYNENFKMNKEQVLTCLKEILGDTDYTQMSLFDD